MGAGAHLYVPNVTHNQVVAGARRRYTGGMNEAPTTKPKVTNLGHGAYEVSLEGVVIGSVFKAHESEAQIANDHGMRYVYAHRITAVWKAADATGRRIGRSWTSYRTRQDALEALVEHAGCRQWDSPSHAVCEPNRPCRVSWPAVTA